MDSRICWIRSVREGAVAWAALSIGALHQFLPVLEPRHVVGRLNQLGHCRSEGQLVAHWSRRGVNRGRHGRGPAEVRNRVPEHGNAALDDVMLTMHQVLRVPVGRVWWLEATDRNCHNK